MKPDPRSLLRAMAQLLRIVGKLTSSQPHSRGILPETNQPLIDATTHPASHPHPPSGEKEQDDDKFLEYPFGMHQFLLLLYIWGVAVVFWLSMGIVAFRYPEWIENCGVSFDRPEVPTPSACAFKDALEKPGLITRILIPCAMVFAIVYAVVRHRGPAGLIQLKKNMVVLIFITTTLIRCLSTYSGHTISRSINLFFWNSNGLLKPFFIYCLMALWFWDWTYLGVYDDVYADDEEFVIRNEKGEVVWECIPIMPADLRLLHQQNFALSTLFNDYPVPYWRREYFPFQDSVVRLGCIHIIDNLIHVRWLRFQIENGPYTPYINNSEFLTLMLIIQMGLYTYARMRTHITFQRHGGDEEQEMVPLGHSSQIIYEESWSQGLFCRPERQNLPRPNSRLKPIRMVLWLLSASFIIVAIVAKIGVKTGVAFSGGDG